MRNVNSIKKISLSWKLTVSILKLLSEAAYASTVFPVIKDIKVKKEFREIKWVWKFKFDFRKKLITLLIGFNENETM